ncbi:MAG TPA: PIG-L family deacetylase [Pelagibacterium sp.]|uniref:PIG-L family deacetylase n=1 Tax=Pelagibacterium sp. TaxID=1967288 RepID=UPI002D1D251E|nr:PIG-L family deacetylase [Pelagibacterium sp.]HWJ87440.1 PIG-L family deacetylase [Pelagibacterium sp.]
MSVSRTALSQRFAQRRSTPRLVALHRAISRLKSTVTVMHSGAHPDDEQNAMLALMRFEFGMRTIVACSTRGEGGQNNLGPERGGSLGVLRTLEMEESAKIIDADVVWLGFGPVDSVHDFGFSKNGEDTLARWGHDVIVERLVRAYRSERPDMVIPTFLDVPGQHGHHRAMTMAAREAIALAADPNAYTEHFDEGLTPWKVSKFYLPAWSGGGDHYDDEVPPPNETVRISATGPDRASGYEYDEIGEWSRYYHASQGMGVWPEAAKTDWPLHLDLGDTNEASIFDNLPKSLADINPALAAADDAIAEAIRAFPENAAIEAALVRAATVLEAWLEATANEHRHRLAQMIYDIDSALLFTAGIDVLAAVDSPILAQGESTTLRIHLAGAPHGSTLALSLPEGVSAQAKSDAEYELSVTADAPLTRSFTREFFTSKANGDVQVTLATTVSGRKISRAFGLEQPLTIVPAATVSIRPEAVIVKAGEAVSDIHFEANIDGKMSGLVMVHGPEWQVNQNNFRYTLSSPGLTAGRHRIEARIGDQPAFSARTITYPHVHPSVSLTPAGFDVLALDLNLPEDRRVAYVGGGSDTVAVWLARMGFEVTELDARALGEDLSKFPTIVVGIFAFGLRPDLAARTEALHRYVEGGGNLVTLYHRPWDGWSAETTPPRFLKIGSPSLRWRVTNPNAEVTLLAPDHPLLAGPNAITVDDFAGWNKERGLYFAAEWAPEYVPLLAMSDAGEAPLEGSLLSAQIGKGRHTHTSLVLHHQLDHLVPGAFRIMANLVAGGRD